MVYRSTVSTHRAERLGNWLDQRRKRVLAVGALSLSSAF
jgi:hypothetical protein